MFSDVIFGRGIALSIIYCFSVSVATRASPEMSGHRISPNLYVPGTTFINTSPCEANWDSDVIIPTILAFSVVD